MKRIQSIDITRGLVMIIMALDHVRDLMHVNALTQNPTDLQTTTTALFFTRWITHLCAPSFVFLSGASAFISFRKEGNLSSSRKFLISRGIWLIALEFTVVNFALLMDIHFRILIMEVIAATGFGFIILALLLKLPSRTIGIIGLVIIFGHNLLQGISFPANPALNFIFSVLFSRNMIQFGPNFSFFIGYPVIPWLGIMLVGFGCGELFEQPMARRKKIFLRIGISSLVLFVLIRFANIYGDPVAWSAQKTSWFSFLSFINVTKYPPSLLFILLMLGFMFLILSFSEGLDNKISRAIKVFGAVPLFYFVVHLFLIHFLMFGMLFLQGFGVGDFVFAQIHFGRPMARSGVGLKVIYLIWMGVVLFLYPLCKWYGQYKASHRQHRLLRYL